MPFETIISWLTALAGLYAAVGVLFAVYFAFAGAAKLDPLAKTGTWGFRLLVLPGAAALWPWLLRRVAAGAGQPEERNPHRQAAKQGGTS